MNANAALQLLKSSGPHDRLRGARALEALAGQSHLPAVQAALARETVPWVRRSLERVLDRLAGTGSTAVDLRGDVGVDEQTLRAISLKVSEETVSMLLHEVHPKVGYIRNAAIREIPNFQESDTKRRIEYLEELLSLLSEFRKASQTPVTVEFDVGELVVGVIAELKSETAMPAGQRPMIVLGDPARIRLAVTNGLRNAIEANAAVPTSEPRTITINWGVDDHSYWISIVDQGVGVHGSVDAMFEIGRTTKQSHFGMGLPIARQAVASLGGHISLSPGDQGGARFEITWEKLSTK